MLLLDQIIKTKSNLSKLKIKHLEQAQVFLSKTEIESKILQDENAELKARIIALQAQQQPKTYAQTASVMPNEAPVPPVNNDQTIIIKAKDNQPATTITENVIKSVKNLRRKGTQIKINKIYSCKSETIVKLPAQENTQTLIDHLRLDTDVNSSAQV